MVAALPGSVPIAPPPPGARAARKPRVLVPACNRVFGNHPFHIAGRRYIDFVRLAGAMPLVVPTARGSDEIDELLALADGVLLTGSPSNVHPSHFREEVADPSLPLDAERDDWTLPLIPKALAGGVPLLGICRGAQEINVALGGSLHQAVHDVQPHRDHRADSKLSVAEQYQRRAHEVRVEPGGLLERLLPVRVFHVNSLHGQAVKQLGRGLRVEARADDGLLEAFTAPDAPGFMLAVQWHPEWLVDDDPVTAALLQAFGDACRARRDAR